jgi:hypothetical protein
MSNLIVPGLAFAIASSPMTYKLTRKVAGPWVSSFEGVATPAGLFLHTLFFLLVLYLVGRFLPRMSKLDCFVEKSDCMLGKPLNSTCAQSPDGMWCRSENPDLDD